MKGVTERLVAGALLAGALGRPALAHADEPVRGRSAEPVSGTAITLAETLYREGRKLLATKRYEEACAKFAESHRLDPATGTLLNLATCHEALGKLASAWREFSDAGRAARREQREDRVEYAEAHIRALEPRLSRLTIRVRAAPGVDDLRIKLDGFVIGSAAYGIAIPVDPGTHRIQAVATGREPWTADVVVRDNADHRQVTVPELEKAVAQAPKELSAARARSSGEVAAERPIPASVYVAGASTLALAGAAVATGFLYLERSREYEALAHDDEGARSRAMTLGYWNAGLTVGALVGLGITAVLYTTRGQRSEASALPRFSAWVVPGEGRVTLESGF